MLQILEIAADAGYEFSLAWYVRARRSQVALPDMQTLFIPPGRGWGGGDSHKNNGGARRTF